jgi:hypothetical protein
MAGRPQSGVGDEQDAFAAKIARQFSQARDGAYLEYDARTWIIVHTR